MHFLPFSPIYETFAHHYPFFCTTGARVSLSISNPTIALAFLTPTRQQYNDKTQMLMMTTMMMMKYYNNNSNTITITVLIMKEGRNRSDDQVMVVVADFDFESVVVVVGQCCVFLIVPPPLLITVYHYYVAYFFIYMIDRSLGWYRVKNVFYSLGSLHHHNRLTPRVVVGTGSVRVCIVSC